MGPRSPFESRQTHSILVLGLYFASCLCVYGAHQRLPWGTPRVGSWEQILVNGFRGGSGFRILFAAFIEPLAPIALTTSSMSKRQGIFEMNWSRLKPRAQNKKPQHDTTLYTSVESQLTFFQTCPEENLLRPCESAITAPINVVWMGAWLNDQLPETA